MTAVDDYTVGYALREIAAGRQDDRGRRIAAQFQDAFDEPNIRYLLESGEFPLLSRLVEDGQPPPMQSFKVGLDWLLDGFALQLRR